MKTSFAMLLSLAALTTAGCAKKDETASTNTVVANDDAAFNEMAAATPTPTASAGQTFVNTAAASDAFEIATSKMALTQGTAPAVKTFATKMIAAHTASTAKLKTVVAGLTPALTPDPTLTPEQQAVVDELKGKTGADFDTTYAAAQTDGHQKTLDALKAYAASGDVPALKTFATGLIPTVTAHLNMAKGLKA